MIDAEKLKLDWRSFEGPWSQEPDHLEWEDPETNYLCEIKRNPELGHLCGYVTVPPWHREIGNADYDEIDVTVHGGLTYSDGAKFGFDCAHLGDVVPRIETARTPESKVIMAGTYRDMTYVQKECASLAKQLKALE